jgi:hypothetical protein
MICIFRNFCIVKVETVADKDGVKCRINGTSDITRDIAEAKDDHGAYHWRATIERGEVAK